MVNITICIIGIAALLGIDEYLSQAKILRAENRRKFVHIAAGIFIAFWPWLISWRSIEVLGLLMFAVVALNRRLRIFGFVKSVKRLTYGDMFYALSVSVCALLTTSKIFFAIAILHLALADSLAAIVGKNFGSRWKYKVFHQAKTVLGSMTFWVASLYILGIGTLFAHDQIGFHQYAVLILAMPPTLTLLENLSPVGLDNLVVPIAVILALNLAQHA